MIGRGVITVLLMIVLLQLANAQVKGSINLSYGVKTGVKLNNVGHSKSLFPVVLGVGFESKLSKKKYSAWTLHARYGVRYYRSGYGVNDYMPDQERFTEANNINFFSDVESKLAQTFVGIPAGLEVRFNPNPVLNSKWPLFSVSLMLNNSFLLSSKFKERVDNMDLGWLSQSGDLRKYASLYHVGFTVDATILRFFNMGVIYQPVSYKGASADFNFEGQSQSPFFELVADNETYKDFLFYMGVNVPLSIFNRKVK